MRNPAGPNPSAPDRRVLRPDGFLAEAYDKDGSTQTGRLEVDDSGVVHFTPTQPKETTE